MDYCDDEKGESNENLNSVLKLNSLKSDVTYNSLQLINFIDSYFKSNNLIYDCDEFTNSNNTLPVSKSRSSFFCYPCIACSSNFYYEASLHLHLERRTTYIKVFCMKCNVFKTFFNRCKLIYHLYSHKNFLIEPLYKQITIDLIPVEKLVLNKTKINLDSIDILDLTSDDLINLENFQARLLKSNFELFKCVICDALFFSTRDLEDHYQNGKKNYLTATGQPDLEESEYMDKYTIDSLAPFRNEQDENISRNIYLNQTETVLLSSYSKSQQDLNEFSIYKLKFASRCSLIANLNFIFNKFNLYNQITPADSMILICPECGLCFNKSNPQIFRNHLISSCFYSIKNFRIKCMQPNCDFACKSRKMTIDHFTQKHIKIVKYCEICFKKGLKVNFIKENDNSNDMNEDGGEEDDSQSIINNHDEITEKLIENHFIEKHGEIGSQSIKQNVKITYKCDCVSPTECSFDTWKFCRKHYMQKLNKVINYINCFICQKNFNFIRYQQHLLAAHKIKDLIFCNQCDAHVTDGSTSIDEHLDNFHKNSKNECLNMILISKDEYLYQCFNCKLFFSSTCNFSHNCMENDSKNNSGHNYFSPIYIKFSSTKKLKDTKDDEKLAQLEKEFFYNNSYNNAEMIVEKETNKKPLDPDIIEISSNDEDYSSIKEKCEVCNKTFHDVDLFKRHIRTHGLFYLKSNGYLKFTSNHVPNILKKSQTKSLSKGYK